MNIVKAKSIDEAVRLLNEGYAVMAGATNIYVDKKKDRLKKENFVDISGLELDYIKEDEQGFHIGALATFDSVERFFEGREDYREIYQAAFNMGGPQIRNRATLVGNIVDSSPASDGAPVLLVNGAVVNVQSVDGAREIGIDDFFISFKKTALKDNELVTSVFIKKQKGKGRFEKVGLRNAMAISVASVALKRTEDGIKIAVGSLAPTPKRLKNVENYVNANGSIDESELEKQLEKDISPITDVRGSAEYRKAVCKNILESSLKEVFGYEL